MKTVLKNVKKNVTKGNFRFLEERDKNFEYLKNTGLTVDDVKEAIMKISPGDHKKGPEEDRDGYEGDIYVFKLNGFEELDDSIYVKVRYNHPNEVVCISFHD